MKSDVLWVVIPAYNESRYISQCLMGFAGQTDKHFRIVLVDNASTDDTVEVARAVAEQHGLQLDIVTEPHKGTGWACRTGFRFAIDNGAVTLARTDADCAPDKAWVAEMRRQFMKGYDFIGGLVKPYRHESFFPKLRFRVAFSIIRLAIYHRHLKQGGTIRRLVMSPGANLAITTDLYSAIGGFSKTSIETQHEDLDLSERALKAAKRVTECRRAVIYTSSRRLMKLGLRGTLKWYGKQEGVIDIR